MRKRSQGFTLIELMIAVAVVGILAALAYPSYSEYVRKTRRAEIAQVLSEQVQILERFYTRNATYANATGLTASNGFYTIAAVLNAQDFTLTASPIAGTAMATDRCANFAITNTGARSNSGSGVTTAECWGR